MVKRNSLDQARHNESVCKYLGKKADFSDWVITTAFYSARYYLEHKIFPLKIKAGTKEVKVSGFNEYLKVKGNFIRKHNQFADLVERYCNEIVTCYDRLQNSSFHARYNRYTFSREVSKTAKSDLDEIKKYCI